MYVQKVSGIVIQKISYTKHEYIFEFDSCKILSAVQNQNADINRGVDKRRMKTKVLLIFSSRR